MDRWEQPGQEPSPPNGPPGQVFGPAYGPVPSEPGRSWPPSGSQWAVAGIVVALAAAALVYRVTRDTGLADTAVLFVGLPAVLALVVALTPKARSVTGMAMKATTIGLLLSMFFFGEGMVCILMAAPLFYGIAGLIGWSVDRARRSGQLRV